MFYTKMWDSKGITIVMGPPGVEKHVISDHVAQEARQSGLSVKKSHNILNRHVNWADTQVVSLAVIVSGSEINVIYSEHLDCPQLDQSGRC